MTGAPRDSSQAENRKLRLLCLHGFRTSGSILRQQLSKWSDSIHELLDLTFLDAPYPARGKSDVEKFFPAPYYEWFQYNHDFTEYENLENTIEFITEFMLQQGPFDGLLGFSQGAILSSVLAGMQEKGRALLKVPPLRFVVSICGAKLIAKSFDSLYSDHIRCPSIHLIGDRDWLRKSGEDLLQSYKSPLVLRFPQGHTVPRLDEDLMKRMRSFLLEQRAAITGSRPRLQGTKESSRLEEQEDFSPCQEIFVQV